MIDINSPANDREQMWQEWAEKAQAGDKKAYNLLLRDIVPYIRNFIGPKLANPDWVDDITQEVLISVHKSLKTYSPDRPFKPWLSTIISFRRTDFLRKHYSARDNVSTSTDSLEFMKSHVTEPLALGELKDVEKALESFPEKQRMVFILMKVQGYTAKEVADQLDMSESAVKVSVHRTTNKLKDMLNQ